MHPVVICDYHGVLVDDEAVHEAAFARVLKDTLSITLTPALYQKHFCGRWGREGFRAFLEAEFPEALERVSVDELLDRKQKVYQSIVEPQNVLYAGVEEVLEELSRSFRLAIVTSTSPGELMSVLKGHPILQLFDKTSVITAENITKGKPDPEGYLKCLGALKIVPPEVVEEAVDAQDEPKRLQAVLDEEAVRRIRRQAVAVEDTPNGIQAVKAAGMRCIAVRHTDPQIARYGPDKVVDSIRQINTDLVWEVLGRPPDAT
ncbi:MAG TPA: HAD family phosphatase [Phycisphaerae bacterium]|nr:HAD family phosphatase [Phycisphaerae bacterium]